VLVIIATLTLCIAGLLLTYLVAYAACPATYRLGTTYDAPLVIPVSAKLNGTTKKGYKVVLLGDSLINYPCQHYDLPQMISSFLPQLQFQFYNYGKDGDKISGITERVDLMLNDVLSNGGLDAVILYWDSDVSDIDEYDMPRTSVGILRTNYRADVEYALNRIKARCPDCYLALAGPEMIGEGPLFPVRTHAIVYYNKQLMLDRYRTINREICSTFHIPYINMRQAFLDAVPSMFYGYSGCLTVDGEHESIRGATVVAKVFASALLYWLSDGTGGNMDFIEVPPPIRTNTTKLGHYQ
jgi:hypothetical protein